VSIPTKSRTRSIKDVHFTDEHVWIYGTVKSLADKHVEIEDGTGTMAMDLAEANKEAGTEATVVRGKLAPGAFVRVIGDVISKTNKKFTFTPVIIQNLDELGIDKELFSRIRSLEQKIAGDKQS